MRTGDLHPAPEACRRLLILGPINTPHTEHLARGARERGLEVAVGGGVWRGVPVPDLEAFGIEVSVATPPSARWLRDLLGRFQPDVVHANWFGSAFLYLVYGATPMAAMAWGSDIYLAGPVHRLRNRFVARYAGAVMADSGHLLEQLVALGASPDRCTLVNWGVDLETFSPARTGRDTTRRELGLPNGRIILSPRSLREVYNPRLILDAFEALAERDPDLHLVLKHIHSDEPELGPLRHPRRVHRIGHVPYEQMADYYRAADVCVSVPKTDSSPRSVWEAMACGSPCVLSDLPWVHELIRDGEHALVVPTDQVSIASAIERVLKEPDLASRLATNARRLVERHRSREAELDRLIELYDRLARTRPGTSRPVRSLQSLAASVGEAVSLVRHRGIPTRG